MPTSCAILQTEGMNARETWLVIKMGVGLNQLLFVIVTLVLYAFFLCKTMWLFQEDNKLILK